MSSSPSSEYWLVTGGAGFIGRRLCRMLDDEGVPFLSVDRLPVKQPWRHGVHLSSDILDLRPDDIPDRVTHVLHLAGASYVPDSFSLPMQYMQDNVLATQHLLETLSLKKQVSRVVAASTCEVYGNTNDGRADETCPLAPRSPYAASKVGLEAIMLAASVKGLFSATAARLFNVYGPGQQANRLIPSTIAALASGRRVSVHGDGTQFRDWTYITDTCEALILLVRHNLGSVPVVNVGTGEIRSVVGIVRHVAAVLGCDAQISNIEDNVASLVSSAGRFDLIRSLGWTSQVSLDDGIQATVRAQKEALSCA